MRDGIVVVSSLHSNTAVIVNEDEPGLLNDLFEWLSEVSPAREDHRHLGRFESAAHVHFQSLLLSRQAIVPFTEGRLELGTKHAVFFVELDGLRPRRIAMKIVGE